MLSLYHPLNCVFRNGTTGWPTWRRSGRSSAEVSSPAPCTVSPRTRRGCGGRAGSARTCTGAQPEACTPWSPGTASCPSTTGARANRDACRVKCVDTIRRYAPGRFTINHFNSINYYFFTILKHDSGAIQTRTFHLSVISHLFYQSSMIHH